MDAKDWRKTMKKQDTRRSKLKNTKRPSKREFIISGFRLIASDNGIVIAASYWGKFKTNFQMFMIIMLIIDLGTSTAVMIENILIVIATALTIISLVDYLVKNKQVLSEGN